MISAVPIDSDAGFPSNHVVVYIEFGGVLIWLIVRSGLHPLLKIGGCTLVTVSIVVIDLSRIYTGAHWPSDVYGATVLAFFLLSIILIVYVILRHTLLLDVRSRYHPQ